MYCHQIVNIFLFLNYYNVSTTFCVIIVKFYQTLHKRIIFIIIFLIFFNAGKLSSYK